MTFRNKGLDAIKLGNVFHQEEVRSLLPALLNEDENSTSCRLPFGGHNSKQNL